MNEGDGKYSMKRDKLQLCRRCQLGTVGYCRAAGLCDEAGIAPFVQRDIMGPGLDTEHATRRYSALFAAVVYTIRQLFIKNHILFNIVTKFPEKL